MPVGLGLTLVAAIGVSHVVERWRPLTLGLAALDPALAPGLGLAALALPVLTALALAPPLERPLFFISGGKLQPAVLVVGARVSGLGAAPRACPSSSPRRNAGPLSAFTQDHGARAADPASAMVAISRPSRSPARTEPRPNAAAASEPRPDAGEPAATPPHDATDDCAICLRPLRSGPRRGGALLCRHQFHSACLEKWARTNQTCPICRSALPRPARSPRRT